MTFHYPLSPSASSRWLACPGSIKLCEGKESEGNEHTRLGTLAHAIAEAAVSKGLRDIADPSICNRCNSLVTSPPCQHCGSPEYRIDREMRGHLIAYLDHVNEIRLRDGVQSWVEVTLASRVIPGLGGTVDFLAIDPENRIGYIVDLKYGSGVAVSAEQNTQLLTYASIASEHHPEIEFWELTIVQPRVGEGQPETVTATLLEIQAHRKRIITATKSDELMDGPQCRWCLAQAECPRLHQIATEAFDVISDNVASESSELLASYLRRRPLLEQFFNSVTETLIGRMQQGEVVEGFKLVESIGNRHWVGSEDEVVKTLKRRKLKVSEIYAKVLRSPAQIEKLGHKDKIQDLTNRSVLGIKLAPESDRRPALDYSNPVDEFQTIENHETIED